MSDTEAKVRELAKLSILSNRISEVHEKNLKAYPFIFFNGVTDAKIDYDLERGENNHVKFDLSLKDGADNPHMERRFETLNQSIKNLFWKEVSISIYMNGKEVYDSKITDIAEKIMEDNKGLFQDLAKAEEAEKSNVR